MKKIFFLMLVLLMGVSASMNAQVRIGGTDDPNPSAVLDLNATDESNNGDLGLALPRVELTSTGESTPLAAFVKGMTVYNTANRNDVTEGTYYCDGNRWIKVRNSTEMIKKSDLSVELSNLIVALAKAGVPSSITCPPSVTGSSGTIYAVGNFGTAGCWMIDNSKEGTPSATRYMQGTEEAKPEGIAGYYYTWEQAKNACPEGFVLPTIAQRNALRAMQQANGMAFGLWVYGGSQNEAFGGFYTGEDGGWISWGTGFRCALAEENMAFGTYLSGPGANAGPAEYMTNVRCIKN
jgi:hypothetical protein